MDYTFEVRAIIHALKFDKFQIGNQWLLIDMATILELEILKEHIDFANPETIFPGSRKFRRHQPSLNKLKWLHNYGFKFSTSHLLLYETYSDEYKFIEKVLNQRN